MNKSWRLLSRLGEFAFMVWLVTVASFLIVAFAPGDAALSMLRIDTVAVTQEEIAAYRAELGLNDPLVVRYWRYLTGLLHGDMGSSLMTGKPVAQELLAALPATLNLAFASLLLAGILVVVFGSLAANYPNSWGARFVDVFNYLGASIPTFWLGLLLIQWFAVDLNWLPSSGWHNGLGLILPTVALAAAIAPPFVKIFRDSFTDTLQRPFVRSSRARGIPESVLLGKHVLRGSLIPVVTMMGVSLGSLLSGSVVVEAVFGLPGMGKLAVEAVTKRDYGIIQGFVLLMGIIVAVINLLVDLSYRLISPEVRLKHQERT